ncbi:CRISPR system precrRNA processing endoribonuclease RAMP protein Cas6 [Caloramator australicus]|uniref:CRISPR repeat RNA endoribonuclease Cas6 n=2 Tax=Caloramator TaxID=44258 RepID=I7KAH0_9CLOT|nr:CRISPR system precrRNA processing endoribonuclease RAMP protein Cas6 [Caloramator australicus]CCJ34757.1 CRISPR repeat RNA endoribonuclease Cas6 [Caloramator australicus RC3]
MFDVRWTRLRFKIELLEDSYLPTQKNSALRGGMGAVLISYFCINKGQCKECLMAENCVVQNIMNPKLEVELPFTKNANTSSPGFVIECMDYKNEYKKGDIIQFDLLIFAKTLNYIPQFIFAFDKLGEKGFGKNRAKYRLDGIYNKEDKLIFKDGVFFKENLMILKLSDYILERQKQINNIKIVQFITPFRFMKNNKLVDDIEFKDFIISLQRRISILNALEGRMINNFETDALGEIVEKNIYWTEFKRYSSRQKSAMKLGGIKGRISFSSDINNFKELVIAGELTHIGKNTSFGLGKYVIEEGSDIIE